MDSSSRLFWASPFVYETSYIPWFSLPHAIEKAAILWKGNETLKWYKACTKLRLAIIKRRRTRSIRQKKKKDNVSCFILNAFMHEARAFHHPICSSSLGILCYLSAPWSFALWSLCSCPFFSEGMYWFRFGCWLF